MSHDFGTRINKEIFPQVSKIFRGIEKKILYFTQLFMEEPYSLLTLVGLRAIFFFAQVQHYSGNPKK
jgi:hypothetical protein